MHPFIVWSNLAYLIPAGIAVFFGMWLVAALMLELSIMSTIFHMRRTPWLMKVDDFSSYLVFLVCIVLLYVGRSSPWFWWAALFIATSFFVRMFLDTNYKHPVYHGVWHICAALVVTCCIFAGASAL